jgi:general secretion pathway protein M
MKFPWRIDLSHRTPRERQILLLGAIVGIPMIIWLAIWQPLLQSNTRWQQQVEQKRTELEWMQQAAAQVIALREGGDRRAQAGSPEQRVTREAGRLVLSVNRIEPGTGNRLNLWFNDADYDKVVRLLDALQTHGFAIENLSLSRQATPGQVNARITLGAAT